MKKFLKILIILLLILAILLGVSWLISRRTAVKNGTTPPTFRQFLNWGTKTPTTTPNSGEVSSVFVDNNVASQSPQGSVSNTPGVAVSQFTNPSSVPTQTSGGQSGGPVVPSGNGGTTPSPGADPTTTPPAQVPPIIPGPECSDADLNIEFTPDQLAQLQALQNRFYAVAQSIHNDADVATETGNWSNFKGKVQKFTELYNTCLAKTVNPPTPDSKVVTGAEYTVRVPTPFWHETDPKYNEKEVFLGGSGVYDAYVTGATPDQIDPYFDYTKPLVPDGGLGGGLLGSPNPNGGFKNQIIFGLRSLERTLRINLW